MTVVILSSAVYTFHLALNVFIRWQCVLIEILAKMNTSPEYNPLELLTQKREREAPFLNKLYNPAFCATIGTGLAMALNWGFRRPIFSGIQKHIAFGVAGGFVGKYIDGKRDESLATRDAVLRHYVELHPDDFPVEQRKKFADVLEKWVPIR